jgi:hypothetical protein
MLSVGYGTSKPNEILTDVYLERGVFSGCLRYSVPVDHKKKMKHSLLQRFTDYAIGNGVIVSTSFGSNRYYDYPERIKLGKWNDTRCVQQFDDKKIGICHIIPAFLIRKSGHETLRSHKIDSIQYAVPFESIIKVSLTRRAYARLYGTSDGSRGVAINVNTPITVSPSIRTAKIIRLDTKK